MGQRQEGGAWQASYLRGSSDFYEENDKAGEYHGKKASSKPFWKDLSENVLNSCSMFGENRFYV